MWDADLAVWTRKRFRCLEELVVLLEEFPGVRGESVAVLPELGAFQVDLLVRPFPDLFVAFSDTLVAYRSAGCNLLRT